MRFDKYMYLLMILVGIGLALGTYEGKLQTDQIIKTGLKSKATIIGQTKTENKKFYGSREFDYKKYTYWPIYEFKTNSNQMVTVHGKVGGLHVTIGKVGTIYYNPRNPAGEFLIVEDHWINYVGVIIGIVFIVVGAFLFYFNYKKERDAF